MRGLCGRFARERISAGGAVAKLRLVAVAAALVIEHRLQGRAPAAEPGDEQFFAQGAPRGLGEHQGVQRGVERHPGDVRASSRLDQGRHSGDCPLSR